MHQTTFTHSNYSTILQSEFQSLKHCIISLHHVVQSNSIWLLLAILHINISVYAFNNILKTQPERNAYLLTTILKLAHLTGIFKNHVDLVLYIIGSD